MVTPADLLAGIAGEFASDAEAGTDPPAVEREDGSWLLSGSLSADGMADRLGIRLPFERDYETTAGFALAQLRHLPETGESFQYGSWRFDIVDMDGRKIDKLLAQCTTDRLEEPDEAHPASSGRVALPPYVTCSRSRSGSRRSCSGRWQVRSSSH